MSAAVASVKSAVAVAIARLLLAASVVVEMGVLVVSKLYKVPLISRRVWGALGVVGFDISSLSLDVMHVLDLGVLQWLLGAIFSRCLQHNAFGSAAPHNHKQKLEGLRELRARMARYYRSLGPSARKSVSRTCTQRKSTRFCKPCIQSQVCP